MQQHIWDRISLPYRAPSIALLSLCVLLTLSLWFSVSSVVPILQTEYGLTDARAALLSSSVSVGFVFGTLASAILGLADRLHPRHFMAISALVAAAW